MATDATGTPTSPDGLAKIDTSVDAPSGVGQNSLADSIQTALTASYVRKPSGIADGEPVLWDAGTGAWVRPGGTADGSKFLRDDGTWADAGSGPTWTYAATPPGSPTTGDIWVYCDADPNSTFTWMFRYNSGNTTYDWEFIGGAPQHASQASGIVSAAASNTWSSALWTPFTVPRDGDYLVHFGCAVVVNGGGSPSYFGVGFGASPATSNFFSINNGMEMYTSKVVKVSGLTASTNVSLYIKDTDSTRRQTFTEVLLALTPIRVS